MLCCLHREPAEPDALDTARDVEALAPLHCVALSAPVLLLRPHEQRQPSAIDGDPAPHQQVGAEHAVDGKASLRPLNYR